MSSTRNNHRQKNIAFMRIGWLLCFGLCLFLLSWLAYAKPTLQKLYVKKPTIMDEVKEAMQKFPQYDCLTIAREFPEPDSEEYRHQIIDPNGPMYAYYNWSEPMEKFQITVQRNMTSPSDCRIVFKILKGQLYRDAVSICDRRIRWKPYLRDRLAGTIEMLLLTLSIYDIPDMDFVINVDDAVDMVKRRGRDLPILSYSMRLATPPEGLRYSAFEAPTVGFTMPSFGVYWDSLGKHQKGGQRKEIRAALKVMAPTHKLIEMEDYNRYAAVVDMDGNGWSDRLPKLLMSNTPVLKQEYKAWTEYFGHLLTEDHVRFFKEDISDLLHVSESTVKLWKDQRLEWEALNRGALEFAKEHVSHTGIFRAMAYALVKYASFANWTVEMEDGYELLPRTLCCHWAWGMPDDFIPRAMYPATQ